MSEYFIYYTESSIVCLILFAIMLGHDLLNVDRQEKQIKYDRSLVAFMLYFISDLFCAATVAGLIFQDTNAAFLINFLDCLFMSYITYSWLQYVMAAEQARYMIRPVNRFAVAIPLIVSAVVMIIIFVSDPSKLIGDGFSPTPLFYVFLVTVPIIYIVSSMIYALRHVRDEKDPVEKRMHLLIGIFPSVVIFGGLLQVIVLPEVPVFCFACTILMVVFYIQSMESQISLDPLTGLNNRGQLHRYVTQDSNLRREGKRTFVIMLDINDFKLINDGFGHSEGDHALVILSQALKKAIGRAGMPLFLSRYGGDEFILLVHPDETQDPEKVISDIRSCLEEECISKGLPYRITVAAGCEELAEENDTFHKCLERADQKMYKDKELFKRTA